MQNIIIKGNATKNVKEKYFLKKFGYKKKNIYLCNIEIRTETTL